MNRHVIRRGHDIPLEGDARDAVERRRRPSTVALRTADITGYTFKVAVMEGDSVVPGQILCRIRQFPDICFRSPAGGVVQEIRRGARRVLKEIVIAPDQKDDPAAFSVFSPIDPSVVDLELLRSHLLQSGLWPFIIQRPLAKIAYPESQPVAVFINAMATAPLAAQPHILLRGREDDLVAGVTALSRFSQGKTYVTVRAGGVPVPGVDRLGGVEVHEFAGPHPSGCPGVHIRMIQPLRRGQTAWCVTATDAADIGYMLRTGRLPTERVVALAGPAAPDPKYYRVRIGAGLTTIFQADIDTSSVRFINGDVLAGATMDASAHLAANQTLLAVIPESSTRVVMGWAMPGFKRYSFFRTFASSLLPRRKVRLDTRLHGGLRAIIDLGQWHQVLPFDIHLSHLVRSILAGDIQEAEDLGLLELSEEDVALCAFVDPSKTDVCEIIRKGLELYESEYI